MPDLTLFLMLGSPGEGGGAAGFIASLLPIAAMIGILWFLLIRPQQKEQQRHREMVRNLKKGDEIVTVGGVYGRIMAIGDERVSLKVAEGVKIDVERNKVVRVLTPHVEEVEARKTP
ncbi:MAG TPA: preprotein translocase subunit YajC [Gemmatimonadota bacterium]|nr:preprotein translocase subunit YajC [Gemmatimonadota bacterium]